MRRLRSHVATFLVLLGFAGALIVLDQTQRLNGVQNGAQRLTTPFESGLSLVSYNVADALDSLRRLGTLKAENEQLRRELDELRPVRVQLLETQKENAALREALKFSDEHPNYMSQMAEVVSRDQPTAVIGRDVTNLVRTIRLNQGQETGIEPGMSVGTALGLAGRVVEAGEGWAKVLLVTDGSSAVTAFLQESGARGVVEGTGDGLVMRYISLDAGVEPGDVVLSSGLGGLFPKGLIIGTVESVERRDINTSQEAIIRPTVDLERLEYVFVIRSFSGTALSETP